MLVLISSFCKNLAYSKTFFMDGKTNSILNFSLKQRSISFQQKSKKILEKKIQQCLDPMVKTLLMTISSNRWV